MVVTARPDTVKLTVGHDPCSEEIAPDSVTTVGPAAWLTVTVRPPTVSVPVRTDADAFSATENVTALLPVPLAGEVRTIHEALEEAVQGHVGAEAVSVTLLVSPPAGASTVAGATVNAQGGGSEEPA